MNSEMESCVEASAVVVWCVGGTENSGPVCVWTSRVRPTGKCEKKELSGGCGLGTGPEGAVPFDSCVRDKGCVSAWRTHQIVTVEDNAMLRAEYLCNKSDSTVWCREAAAQ